MFSMLPAIIFYFTKYIKKAAKTFHSASEMSHMAVREGKPLSVGIHGNSYNGH